MIVNTMSLQEIHVELQKDVREIRSSLYYKQKDFGSAVLKSRRYPVQHRYPIKSKKRQNIFHALFIAHRRSHWKRPLLNLYCIYARPEGLYCAYMDTGNRLTIIFPPHFFSRYRERVVKDYSLGTEALIHRFCSRTWTISFHPMPTEMQRELAKCNGDLKDEEVQFEAICPDGILFGQRTDDVVLVKTIVTRSMLYADQVPLYEDIHRRYQDHIRMDYCKEEAEFILGLEEEHGQ